MYYEEKYANCILYFRNSPHDQWMPIPHAKLSERVVSAEAKNKLLTEALENILEEIPNRPLAVTRIISEIAKKALKEAGL